MFFPLLVGCNRLGPVAESQYGLNERIEVGPLAYTIHEATWAHEIGEGENLKQPDGCFLVIRLSVRNTGNEEVTLPLLSVVNEAGETRLEYAEANGVAEWLGVLRTIAPSETIQGRIVFEVKTGNCRLRLSDAGEAYHERIAWVRVPAAL